MSATGAARGCATVAAECEMLLEEGVPVCGVCLYPILGMPEWHSPDGMDADGTLGSRSRTPSRTARGSHAGPCSMPSARRNGSTNLHATALAQRAEALDAGRRRKRRRAGSDDALQFAAE